MTTTARRSLIAALLTAASLASVAAYRSGRPLTLIAPVVQPMPPLPAFADAIYLIDPSSPRRADARRLAGADGTNVPAGWSTDGALVFVSDRMGPRAILAQRPDGEASWRVADHPGMTRHARTTPDGSAVLFLVDTARRLTPHSILRVSVDGGPVHEIVSGHFVDGGARCAVAPAMLCAVAEPHDDGRHIIFSALNPETGRGRELARVNANDFADLRWALSPDGLRIGVTDGKNPRIRIVMIGGSAAESITVSGHHGFANISFTHDGRGVMVPSTNVAGASLLSIALDGEARLLWQEPGAIDISGMPSTDGRHVAVWVRKPRLARSSSTH